ncbi:MAG: hypothetical protein CFE43_10795 [Burkholderiales bacterium PBB3]|nr:MAG: hypothetical protein CFE43_10795 [Burkholderiales bacterium PBB3]
MHTYLWRLIGATVVCAIYLVVVNHYFGVVALALSAPLVGIAFTRLVIDAAAELGWRVRTSVLAPLSGKHYVYQGFNLRVVQDDDFGRWLAMDDVRHIVGSGATDKALSQTYPGGWQVLEGKGHLRDDALMHYLGREPSTRAVKLRNWVEHSIAVSARTERKRRGIYLRDPMLPATDDQ